MWPGAVLVGRRKEMRVWSAMEASDVFTPTFAARIGAVAGYDQSVRKETMEST